MAHGYTVHRCTVDSYMAMATMHPHLPHDNNTISMIVIALMDNEQPCKQRETRGSRYKKPRALALLEPEIRQIATDDFGDRGSHEKKKGF